MRRLFTIARAQGAAAVLSRGADLALRTMAACLSALRASVVETRDASLLWAPRRLNTPAAPGAVVVSIYALAGTSPRRTSALLRMLARETKKVAPCEVFLVDEQPVAQINRLREKAKGRYVYVCSANTILHDGSLAGLVAALERDPSAAAAVSQIRSPDRRIADAGRLLRNDGSWHVYGQGESPRDPRFRYVRSIGAPAAVSVLWRSGEIGLNALPEAYTGPLALDYALADAALGAASAGHKTLYQPASVVTLRDTAGASQDPANQSTLVQRRGAEIDALCSQQSSLEATARAVGHTEAILVVDDHVPFTDRDAGSERMADLLESMTARAHVILGTAKHRAYGPYGDRIRQAGVELITGLNEEALARLAQWQLPVRTIWLSRADVAARYLLAMRRIFPNARILYDTVDLHFVRLQRQQAVTSAPTDWARLEGTELALARACDGTIVTSGVERALLRERGVQTVHIVSMAAATPPVRATAEGSGMIFFGNYAHLPNVDGALWLAQEILPRVRRRLPGIGLTIAGADPTPEIWRWHLDGVAVTGYVPDLDALIARHRVAALPLRFGAGVKGKVLRAMACGMPVVTTPIGLEGITERDERFAVGSTAEELAAEIVRAYSDLERWNELSHLSQTVAARFSERALAEQLDAALNVAER